jgi:hypothetical protein
MADAKPCVLYLTEHTTSGTMADAAPTAQAGADLPPLPEGVSEAEVMAKGNEILLQLHAAAKAGKVDEMEELLNKHANLATVRDRETFVSKPISLAQLVLSVHSASLIVRKLMCHGLHGDDLSAEIPQDSQAHVHCPSGQLVSLSLCVGVVCLRAVFCPARGCSVWPRGGCASAAALRCVARAARQGRPDPPGPRTSQTPTRGAGRAMDTRQAVPTRHQAGQRQHHAQAFGATTTGLWGTCCPLLDYPR